MGVVGDVKQYGLDRDPVDTAYVPEAQYAMGNTILIKTAGDPMNYAGQLRKAVFAIDKDQPVTDIKSLDELRGDSLAGTRITSILLALFAALALIIAATGLSGVTALLVSQRTREIGIRLALGAQRSEVLSMVVRQSMRVIFIGLGIGVVGALLDIALVDQSAVQNTRHRSADLCWRRCGFTHGGTRSQLPAGAPRDKGESDDCVTVRIVRPINAHEKEQGRRNKRWVNFFVASTIC